VFSFLDAYDVCRPKFPPFLRLHIHFLVPGPISSLVPLPYHSCYPFPAYPILTLLLLYPPLISPSPLPFGCLPLSFPTTSSLFLCFSSLSPLHIPPSPSSPTLLHFPLPLHLHVSSSPSSLPPLHAASSDLASYSFSITFSICPSLPLPSPIRCTARVHRVAYAV